MFITEATFGLPVFRHPDTRAEVRKLLDSVALFPERAHIVGAYALGKAQRVMALLREEGYDQPIYLHGAMERLTEFYKSEGIPLGETPKVAAAERVEARRRHRALPALLDPGSLVPPLSRSRSPASPPAGCGCGRERARRASSCRS